MVYKKRNSNWMFTLRVIGVITYILLQAAFIGIGVYFIKAALGIDLIPGWSLFH